MAKRYQRGNQKSSIEEGQTTQWLKDTKGVIRSRQSKKDRQHNGLKIPKGYSEVVNRRTDNTMAKRYQRGNQKSSIEGQTTQWPKDTKGVVRSRQSKKDRQHNGQKRKGNRTNHGLQNTVHRKLKTALNEQN